jgi:hypothetical protein
VCWAWHFGARCAGRAWNGNDKSFSDRREEAKSVEGVSALVGMVHQVGSPISTVEAQDFFAQGFSAEILTTNLGAVEFKDSYGPLSLHVAVGSRGPYGFRYGADARSGHGGGSIAFAPHHLRTGQRLAWRSLVTP